MAVIALDVGGSSVKHGLVTLADAPEVTLDTTPINSLGSTSEIIGTLSSIIEAYLDQQESQPQIGIGFPGPFDYNDGVSYITGLAKYEAIYGLNVRLLLTEALDREDLDIRFRNDAEAAIVGEAIYGAGANYSRIIGVTLGTGMGSAFIEDGQRIQHGRGIPEGGWLYPVLFNNVRADDVFSTRGLMQRFAEAGIPCDDIADADRSDPQVQRVFAQFGADLGEFLQPFVRSFQADAVILLGGLSGAFDLFADEIKAPLQTTRVIRGTLDERATLLGTAQLFA